MKVYYKIGLMKKKSYYTLQKLNYLTVRLQLYIIYNLFVSLVGYDIYYWGKLNYYVRYNMTGFINQMTNTTFSLKHIALVICFLNFYLF